MIQHTAKPIMKRIVEAEELLKSIHDPEERLAIENYIGNLYDSVHELEKTPNTFSFENYLGAKEFNRFCSRRISYERKWFQKFLKDKKFHEIYLRNILIGQEEDIEELSDFSFPSDPPISRKKLVEILYAFFEDMGFVDLFDQYYRQQHIFAIGKNQKGNNVGYLEFNPVSKSGEIFVRNFKNDVSTLKIIAHEMGHVVDHTFDQDVPSFNQQVFASFYGEVLSRLFEKRMEHFLLLNNILPSSTKDAIVSSAIIHHSDVLEALIFSLMSKDCLRHYEYFSWDVDTFKKKMKRHFLDSFNYKQSLRKIQSADITNVYRYAYGDIISMFLLEEIEKNGVSGDLFDYFMERRCDLFDQKFMFEGGFEPEEYIRMYQDEIKLVKK